MHEDKRKSNGEVRINSNEGTTRLKNKKYPERSKFTPSAMAASMKYKKQSKKAN